MSSPTEDRDPFEGDVLGRPTSYKDLAHIHPRTLKVMAMSDQQVDMALRLLTVPFESLPQPPFFRRLSRKSTEKHRRAVAHDLALAAVTLRRVPTGAEADALAYHLTKKLSREAWASPLAAATAVVLTTRTRSSFRFPFYTPKASWFDPSAFPTRSRPVLAGDAATLTWHCLRFGAYGMVCKLLVGSFVASFAQTSHLMGILRDDRLRAMRESVADMAKKRIASRSGAQDGAAARSDEAAPFQQSQPYQPAPQARWPTPSQPPPPRPQQQQPPSWSQTGPDAQAALQDDDPFLVDDASPVAPSQRQQPQRSTAGATASPAGGSAWDRIRQRAKSEENGWNTATQQDGNPRAQSKTEQYTYSSAEQEKAYAREQAQREFDAMLERERRGIGESGGRS